MISLSDVSILIKTFLRDDHLFNAIDGIHKTMPRAHLIIVDDGWPTDRKRSMYDALQKDGHKVIIMSFDSGFGAKSNEGMRVFQSGKTDYLLIASDDFEFRPPSVRDGIANLLDVMHCNSSVDIASGRVNGGAYEFNLEIRGDYEHGIELYEHSIWKDEMLRHQVPWFVECDLTVNYSLIRKRVFEKVWWENDIKIGGGEHGAFFYDCKINGFKTVFVPGVNIHECKIPSLPVYRGYRARSNNASRPCFDRRHIVKYVLGNGAVDYDVTGNRG